MAQATRSRRSFGSTRRLPSGRWQASYWWHGERHVAPQTWSSKGDASAWLAGQEDAIRRGAWADPTAGKVTVGDLAQRWLETTVHLTPKSQLSVESLVRSRILPTFQDRRVAALSATDIRQWIAEMAGEGLSASRIRQAHGVLCRMLRSAGVANPCPDIRLPSVKRSEVRFLSIDEIEMLAQAAGDYQVFIQLLAYGGLRFGEAAAIRARRVDGGQRRLVVAESVTEVSGHVTFGEPKTHQHRTVAIPAFLADELGALVAAAPTPDSLLFTGRHGGPLRYSNFRARVWNPAAAEVGLEWATPHTLRHSAATLLLGAGATVKDVQAQLGHADASVTLNIYAGVISSHADDLAAGGSTPSGTLPCRAGRMPGLRARKAP